MSDSVVRFQVLSGRLNDWNRHLIRMGLGEWGMFCAYSQKDYLVVRCCVG